MSHQNYKKTCTHDEATALFRVGKSTIIAGSAWQINESLDRLQPNTLVSVGGRGLAQAAKEEMVTFDTHSKKHFKATYAATPQVWVPQGTIIVDWPDMSAPPMDSEWWSAFFEDLSHFDGRVAVFCMGGHGRTGTTLSILAWMSGACGEDDPVEWVRENYCADAVETQNQLEYLRELGIVTNAKPTRMPATVIYEAMSESDFGDVGLDPDEALATIGKEVECDVCFEVGSKYDLDSKMWLCKNCDIQAAELGGVKEALCVDCNSGPAFWHPAWKEFFCNPCMPNNASLEQKVLKAA